MNKDYHDYVIKDGVFVGKFEEMYKNCEDPWKQKDDVEKSYSKQCSIASIARISPKNVLEIGCGLGYYTAYMKNCFPDIEFTGMDISKTAIEKAKTMFPHIEFVVENVENLGIVLEEAEKKRRGYDVVILSEIMWYILDKCDAVIETMVSRLQGKHILINQTFYNGGQKYGREYFTTPDEMIEFIGLECIEEVVERTKGAGESFASHTLYKIGERK